MSLLGDLLAGALGEIASGLEIGPSSDRGRLQLSSFVGAVAGVLNGWLALVSPDAWLTSTWAWGAVTVGTLAGIGGVTLSVSHLTRHRTEVRWASASLALNGIAILVAWGLHVN